MNVVEVYKNITRLRGRVTRDGNKKTDFQTLSLLTTPSDLSLFPFSHRKIGTLIKKMRSRFVVKSKKKTFRYWTCQDIPQTKGKIYIKSKNTIFYWIIVKLIPKNLFLKSPSLFLSLPPSVPLFSSDYFSLMFDTSALFRKDVSTTQFE